MRLVRWLLILAGLILFLGLVADPDSGKSRPVSPPESREWNEQGGPDGKSLDSTQPDSNPGRQ